MLTHIHSRKVMLAYTWYNLKAGCLWPTEHTLYICFNYLGKNLSRNENKVMVFQESRIELNGHCG